MRRSLVTSTAVAMALAGLAALAAPSDAEAQTRRSRTVVVITPSYLTAGTQVSPGETRAAVPIADARFRSSSYDIPGFTRDRYWSSPFYLPYPHTSIAFDSPLGRRMPGER
jgi:hypothetical protein